jgi:tripartite motif-containing protein 71
MNVASVLLSAPGSQLGQLSAPSALAIHDGRVYVGESGNDRIQVFDLNGNYLIQWGSEGTGDGQFDDIGGVAIDRYGFVYVSDILNNRVQKFSPDGEFLAKWGSQGTANGFFLSPGDLVAEETGNVYVADMLNFRIQVFRPVN